MFSARYLLCVQILVLGLGLNIKTNALECYVCKGCRTVTSNDIGTCRPRMRPTTERPDTDSTSIRPSVTEPQTTHEPEATNKPVSTEEPLTTSTVFSSPNSDQDVLYDVNVRHNRARRYNPYYDFVPMRALKDADDDDDVEAEARCLVVTFIEANGEANVIRGCSYESDDIEARCREALGDSYNGTMQSCKVCNGELCNSSTTSTYTFSLMILSVLFTVKMSY
ncbi:hypothetical protein ABMA28_005107 [Loxostege sticticalis]|uniref:Protein sleepless n=1 Tax=Loxostege sticticalis TaxID=481309 RepID=A0ABD0SPE5_LOXSC